MRVGISLFLLSLVAFWPQLSFPEWRGTEARRVLIAYEMLHSGDYMVPYALLMPLVVAWTVFPDRADYYANSLRSLRPVASVLGREMDSRGVEDLQAFGHVRAAVQLYTKRIPPGDECMRRDPAAQWVIQEERGHNYSMLLTFRPPGYTDRVRVRGHDKTFALRERTQR